jgi:alcohol dehydrogenase class IV
MEQFQLNHPTKIFFGENSLQEVGKQAKILGKIILVVTRGSAMEKTGIVKKLQESFTKEGVKGIFYSGMSGEPTLDEIQRAYEKLSGKKIDAVIGIGGGSALDSAKAISACLAEKKGITELLKSSSFSALPLILIPTTAGTGSEVSKGAILSDSKNEVKVGLRGESLLAKVAIIDPVLTYSLPKSVTILSGFDAFAHAVESIISTSANTFTRTLSEKAITDIYTNLPMVVKNPKNKNSRKEISFASFLMGYNLVFASTGLPHRIQYSFGTIPGMSHAMGLAILYPAWFAEAIKTIPEKMKLVGRAMGMTEKELASSTWQKKLQKRLEMFMKQMNLTKKLGDFNIQKKDLSLLADKVTGNMAMDPVYKGKQTILKILRKSW